MLKEKIKSFILGAITATLLVSAFSVFSETIDKTITATYRDIKIYIEGILIEPKDANGNTVEPFIYGGTTYLPVRAISEAFGHDITWDGETSSIYINEDIPNPAHEGIDFVEIFDHGEYLVNFKRVGADENSNSYLYFDLISDGREIGEPSQVRVNANAMVVRNAEKGDVNLGSIIDYVAFVEGDSLTYYAEGEDGYIIFTLNYDGTITAEQYGVAGMGAGVSMAGEYEFDGVG